MKWKNVNTSDNLDVWYFVATKLIAFIYKKKITKIVEDNSVFQHGKQELYKTAMVKHAVD